MPKLRNETWSQIRPPGGLRRSGTTGSIEPRKNLDEDNRMISHVTELADMVELAIHCAGGTLSQWSVEELLGRPDIDPAMQYNEHHFRGNQSKDGRKVRISPAGRALKNLQNAKRIRVSDDGLLTLTPKGQRSVSK